MYPRHAEFNIREVLADTPVVSIMGPRQVGKTTLAKYIAPERHYVTLDDENLLKTALNDGLGFIHSLPEFVIIDEVQRAPNLMLAIKKSVDENRIPGRFLLTGSANIALLNLVQDSLAGRHEAIHLFPLTSHEIAKQPIQTSFVQGLIEKRIKPTLNAYPDTLAKLKDVVCRGGYPEPLSRNDKRAGRWYKVYAEDLAMRDASTLQDIRQPDALYRLLRLCAARTASLLEVNSLANDAQISVPTTKEYLQVLEKLFLIHLLPSWSSNLNKRLIKSPKIHVVDSGMICALNSLSPGQWLERASLFGHVLESYVVQQIISQINWIDDEIACFHFRDHKKKEVDIVLERGNDVWGIEIKRAATLSNSDLKGMRQLMMSAAGRWRGGIVLYSGDHILPTDMPEVLAVPYGVFWDGIAK